MKHHLACKILLLAAAILVVCRPAPTGHGPDTEPGTPSLHLTAGMKVTLVPTVLGLGAGLRKWTKGDYGTRQITVVETRPDLLVVEWSEEVREETAASRQRRAAFERNPPVTGVGEPEPEPPEPEYAVRVKRGRIRLPGLGDSREMVLPALWPEGDQTFAGSSLIWLSPAAFGELRSTRRTKWSLGLLESPFFQPAAAVREVRQGLDALRERLGHSAAESEAFDEIEADRDFVSFALEIDGQPAEVRAIVARNWFAEYVLLDREDNPLILKVTLNPISGGGLDVLSPLMALKAVVGYQVVAISS